MNVLEVFTGNPLNTAVGQLIDRATDGSLESDDWTLNMEICDIINQTEDGPKDAVRAIRKKISNSVGKDWRAITYCLVVLETCVKNCGKRFHIQVANKDFLHDLVKIIAPKNEPTVLVQEKILGLIQSWADAFRGASELKAVEITYQELKSKGIEFPATDLDHLAPIHTPKSHPDPSAARTGTAPAHTAPAHTAPAHTASGQLPPRATPTAYPATIVPGSGPVQAERPGGSRTVGPEQMSKLRADIDIVQGNCRVFNEMLNAATPGSSEMSPDTIELLRELSRTCRQMQQRVVVLIEQLADEQVTEVLLRVNDDLNNAFLRYDRLERFLNMPVASQPANPNLPPPSIDAVIPSAAAPANQSLIDFGTDGDPVAPPRASASALAAHVDSMSLTSPSNIASISDVPTSNPAPKPAESDEFDVFVQSRQYDATQHSTAASYAYQTEASQTIGSIGAAAAKSSPYVDSVEASATSSEFDQFLSERVAAGDNLPDKKPDADSSRPSASKNGSGRHLHKDDSENALFAL
ncbi:TOM1-like protein 2 isoform X2 [Watersipora subatra]|uniref:TOM1-like protein 2 isoform X2 n=1 Tax=Watersipora subatra TaxID=2589382 RepID=UPI00355B0303